MAMECLHFGTMSGPCLDHDGTIFGLGLLLDHLVVALLTYARYVGQPQSTSGLVYT